MSTYKQQLLLEYLGFSPGPLDGIEGPKTRAATKKFQTAYGLEATEKSLTDAVAGLIEPAGVNIDTAPDEADWWRDIRYFKRSEFACKCGGQFCDGFPAEPQEAMVRIADQIREHFGAPARVVSGLRCPAHNKEVGGKATSQHMYGEAVDLRVDGVGWEKLLAYTKTLPGVRFAYHIEGSNNIHFDIPAGER